MKNKKTLAFLCALSFAMALTVGACTKKSNKTDSAGDESNTSSEGGGTSSSQSGGEVKKWTVTFDSQGGSPVSPVQVENGKKVAKPANPTRSDYDFTGWYQEAAAVTEFDFATPITSNWTLFAGWTASGGGHVDPPEPPEPVDSEYSVKIGGTSYALEKNESATLQPTQTGEYVGTIASVKQNDSVVFYHEDAEINENIGSDPEDAENHNNVVGDAANGFQIHNDASSVNVYFKTWESGGHSFWITGYEDGGVTPPQPTDESYYVTIGDAEYELVKDNNVSLVANQKGQYVANVASVSKDAVVVFYNPQKTAITDGIGSDPEDAENKNNIVVSDGFKIHNDAENVTVYFKTWENGGHSFWVTGYEAGQVIPPDPENTITIYFRDASWWNKDAASTNFVAWTGEQPSGRGQMMTHLEWVPAQGFNYWSCTIASDSEYIMFFRTGGNNGADDWGARTIAVSLTERSEHNMYDISATSAQWYGEGHSVTGVWADYAA